MRRARRAAALGLLTWLAACASPSDTASGPPARAASGFHYSGISHVSWWHDAYLGTGASASRSRLASTRANWAGLLVTWYLERRDSDAIGPDPETTPTDAALIEAIRDLHRLGLQVMLKPHVDVEDGTWRGSIRPADPKAWFASYAAFIERYAALAQANEVELFCVGTELATLSDARYAADWAEVIARVRAQYRGLLTYAANAVEPADEFTSVSFWERVDVMGLDAYTPLTEKYGPSRRELVAGWSRNRYGQNMVAAFRNWQASHGKPVIFTEIGYRSVDGANRAPYDYSADSSYDAGEQADCYAAAFEVWSREAAWMKGIFWWDWGVEPPAPADTDYTPRDKPAEEMLRLWNGD